MNTLSVIKNISIPKMKMTMKALILALSIILPSDAYQNNHLPITEYPIFIKSLQECNREEPLGMASGKIQEWQISASSTFPKGWDKFCGLEYARLYQPNNYTWCSKFKTSTEWLQVDLGLVSKVTGFMTQGRGDGLAWVSSYLVSYSLDGSNWNYVMDSQGNGRVFDGNTDSYRVKHAYVDDAMFTRFVKFHVVNWSGHPSMRAEILGCQVCDDYIGNPPYVKLSASSVKHSLHTCQAEDGHIVTKKSWCPKENNSNQWLKFDLGPPTLITGVVTMGKGDSKKKHWVSRYLISYSNDSVLWHYYKDSSQTDTKEFGGNSDKNSPRIHYLNLPFVARYVRFHPTKWNFQISMRAGLIGCPFKGQCGPDFVRISNNTPCVENLSYLKESWVNNRRPHHHSSSQQQYSKRHADENWSIGQARKAVDGDGGKRIPTCTVLDNFIVEKPTWMVDLGRKSTVTGLFIYTRQFPDGKADAGSEFIFSLRNNSYSDKEIRHIYKDYVHNLEKLTVYVDNKGRRSEHVETSYVRGSFMSPRHTHQYANPENMCGSISRINDALLHLKLHLRCNRQMTGRYVYIEATGIPAKNKKHFAAIICEVVVYA